MKGSFCFKCKELVGFAHIEILAKGCVWREKNWSCLCTFAHTIWPPEGSNTIIFIQHQEDSLYYSQTNKNRSGITFCCVSVCCKVVS